MSTQEKRVPKKSALIIKLLFLWLIVLWGILFLAYCKTGESFSMVWIDLKNGFVDCPRVPQYFKNKVIAVSVMFVCLIVGSGITDELKWKTIFSEKQWVLSAKMRWIHGIVNLGLCIAAVMFVGTIVSAVKPMMKYLDRGDSWKGDALIAHACGGIDNTEYTNSLEAFELSYAQGIRSMEVDFSITADGKMVCCHDWDREFCSKYEEGHVYTEEEFLNIKIYNQYTPISVDMLFELMKKYDDVWIVTDTKETEWEEVQKEFNYLLERAKATDSMEVLDRFVVQLYNLEMYDAVEEVYPFSSYILTLYQLGKPKTEDFASISRYCKQRKIETITMPYKWNKPEDMDIVNRYGLNLYVHTVNDMEILEPLQDMGVKGFYTDYITPGMMAE